MVRKLDRSALRVEVGSWDGVVGGTIGQLMLSLGKIVSLVQDDRGVALIGKEDEDAGVSAKGVESRTFRGAEVRLLRESGGEFGVGNVGEDVGNVTFNRVVRGESGGFGRTGRSEL